MCRNYASYTSAAYFLRIISHITCFFLFLSFLDNVLCQSLQIILLITSNTPVASRSEEYKKPAKYRSAANSGLDFPRTIERGRGEGRERGRERNVCVSDHEWERN